MMILVALGANLQGLDGASPQSTLRRAVTRLLRLPGLRVTAQSRWYRTAPVPPSGQPDYINGVVALAANQGIRVDPAVLLAQLLTIESEFGRQRAEVNAARTLDLDLIAMDDLVRTAPDPILPHPRAHLRRFVMAPLVDVAPDWMHPILNETATALLARLRNEGVTSLG
jgi:2-amino-4-hydroxy-6-hydroxymethyldihydropteridine diphosphokinase